MLSGQSEAGGASLPDTVICENRVFCNPVSLTSKPEEACIYEAHKKYIDLHYIVAGREGIATADVKSLTESVSYNAERDIAFYKAARLLVIC